MESPSDHPPEQPLEQPPELVWVRPYEPAPRLANVLHRVMAWSVLWLAVLVLFTAYLAPMLVQAISQQPSSAEPRPTPDELILGRYAVGISELGEHASGPWRSALAGEGAGAVIKELEEDADQTVQRLRVIMVVGELQGAEAAQEAMRELDASTTLTPGERDDLATLRAIYRAENLDAATRDRLIDRHGWFAELALVFGDSASDPVRQQVVGSAMRTAVALVVMNLGLLALAVLGLTLFITAIVLFAVGILRTHYQPARSAERTLPFLETAALFLLLMLALSVLLAVVELVVGLPVVWMVPLLLVFCLLWPLLRRVDWAGFRQAMGWHRGKGVWREVGAGLVGYLACLPILGVGMMLTLLLTWMLDGQMDHPMVDDVTMGSGPILALVFLLAVVWAPLVEESVFRGALYHYLRSGWGVAVSALLSGLIFALVHPQGIVGVPILASMGVVMALLREWRGSLLAPITAHALHNFAVTLVMVLMLA